MKRALLILAILGMAFSPLMVTQAEAAPAKHHVVKHHRKLIKKRVVHRTVRHHHKHTA